MKTRSSKLLTPVLAALGIVAAVAFYQLNHSGGLAEAAFAQGAPKAAPDFALKDVTGKVYHLSDYRGKVVMLNFWATWCPPCNKEIPEFGELQKEYGAQGLQFLGIALDEEGMAKIQPWLAKHAVTYPILLPDPKVTSAYGDMPSIPVTFVIDRKGLIRSSFVGMRQKSAVEDLFKPLLLETASAGQ